VDHGERAARTAGDGEALRRFFAVLSWAVVLAGASMTGFGCWFFLGYGGPGSWVLAAAWSSAWILLTGFAWGVVSLAGLVAGHIGNSWSARIRPDGGPPPGPGEVRPDNPLPSSATGG
jgi:hypothetical protein